MNKETILIEEQGLRDGIQNLSILIPTEKKIEYVHKLVTAGVKRIQIASFVHPKLVPQMADAEAVCRKVEKVDGVVYSGLVLNLKGVERAIEADLNHISCSISASDAHSQKNARMSLSEARSAFRQMVELGKSNNIKIRGGIQCAFGCRYEGKIEKDLVLDMVKAHLDTGVDEVALADSTGMAHPMQMEELMTTVIEMAGSIPVVLHLHNTENKGYANLYAAIKSGVGIFDTAFGGLGGCPFIKSATGNVATEDVIHMVEQMGFSTGIDVTVLQVISSEIETMLNSPLPGMMYKLKKNQDIKFT